MAWIRFAPLLLLLASPALAQNEAHLARTTEGAGLTPKLGAQIPEGLVFTRSDGVLVSLDSLVTRPTLLTFVYHTCPMLCSVLLDGLTRALKDVPWVPGEEYDLITVSIDPQEAPATAHRQRARYLSILDEPEADWHFLTGNEETIGSLTSSVGFGFAWVDEQQEYAHPSTLVFLSSDGTVTRYLPGLAPHGRDIRASLVEASEGTVGSLLDRAFLLCFQYDPASNSYVFAAKRAMKIGGGVTAFLLVGLLLILWRREAHDRSFAGTHRTAAAAAD